MPSWTCTDGILELTLDREPCNEIGRAMVGALEDFLAAVPTFDAHAVIVHSSVRGGFSAGADLRELYRGLVERPEAARDGASLGVGHAVGQEVEGIGLGVLEL